MPTIEQFVAVLNLHFGDTIRAKPMKQTDAGLVGWTPEQVLEDYRKSVQAALDWANGIVP